MKRILNLGAGTQSSGVYLMMLQDEIEPADMAVFADTQWEPYQVYDTLEWLKEVGGDRIPIHTITAGNIREDTMEHQTRAVTSDKKRFASMPLHVMSPSGESKGMVRRQCTREYKIDPIERFIRTDVLGLKKGQRWPTEPSITQIYGISLDEMQRMRSPQRPCLVNEYPLVERRLRRSDVIAWLDRNYPGKMFVRSACCGCPFRSNREWDWLRQNDPTGWQSAVELDEAIRNAEGMNGTVYLHRSCKPLSEVAPYDDPNQMDLFNEECEGMCGL